MTCKIVRDDDGQVQMIACGSSWGLGVYSWEGEFEGEGGSVYGFLPTDVDPHEVSPDFESNTKEEIAAWEEAKRKCPCPMGDYERAQASATSEASAPTQ
jgi:hypothetical protein